MRKCEVTNKKPNFGKTRRHRRGSAGGVSGAWSKKATAKSKKQDINLRKVRVVDQSGSKKTITVSMKAYKKARQQEGRFNEEFTLQNFQVPATK